MAGVDQYLRTDIYPVLINIQVLAAVHYKRPDGWGFASRQHETWTRQRNDTGDILSSAQGLKSLYRLYLCIPWLESRVFERLISSHSGLSQIDFAVIIVDSSDGDLSRGKPVSIYPL